MQPTALIGDVHGDAARLRAALSEVPSDRRVVLLGDYVDRGPDSRRVLDSLVEAKARLRERLVLLRGNHEVTLLEFLDGAAPQALVRHGGLPTVRSYVHEPEPQVFEQFRRDFPAAHRALLDSTVLFIDEPGLFASHAGWDPAEPSGRSVAQMTLGGGRALFDPETARPPRGLAVFGHYTQASRLPYVTASVICLDTGCGTAPDAPLTLLLLPERVHRQF